MPTITFGELKKTFRSSSDTLKEIFEKENYKAKDLSTKKEGTEIRITNKLNSLYEVLRPHGFGYPHDSYIINFKYLASCKKEELRLQGFPDTVFKITRSKSVEFNQLKKEFLTSKYGEH